MALRATIFKVNLRVSDLDRNYYQTHALTMARHPSETDERLMARLLAFALHAHDSLVFTKGLSDSDEPELWRRDLTGTIVQWIEVGTPDVRRIQKARSRASEVSLLVYGATNPRWVDALRELLKRTDNVSVSTIDPEQSQALSQWAQRQMNIDCTIQDGIVWMDDGTRTIEIHPRPF